MFNLLVDPYLPINKALFSYKEPRPSVEEIRQEFLAKNRTYMECYQLPKQEEAVTYLAKSIDPNDGGYVDQEPWAVVLTCADSRVDPNAIFCQPSGRLFVIRTAGNTADGKTMANIAYALHQLSVPLVIVMGHEDCGAVKAAAQCIQGEGQAAACALYPEFIKPIERAVDMQLPYGRENVDRSVRNNAAMVADDLRQSGRLTNAASPRLLVVDAVYFHLSDGRAEFL